MSTAPSPPPLEPNSTPTPPPIGFDYTRPISGNTGLYKFAWRAMRAGSTSGPKPYRLAVWARRLWLPADIIGIIAIAFFGQSPLFLSWAILAGVVPRFILETATWIHLLPANFFGRPITRAVIVLEVFILVYLVALGLGFAFLLWAAPAVLVLFFWRVARKTGGMAKTVGLIWKATISAAAQAAADSAGPTAPGDTALAPVRRTRVVSRAASEAGAVPETKAEDPR